MHDYKCFFLLSTVPEANFCSFEWTSFKFKEFHNCMQFTTLRFCFPLGLVNYMSHIGTSDGFVIRHFEPYSLGTVNLRDQKSSYFEVYSWTIGGVATSALSWRSIIALKWMILTRLSLSATQHYFIRSIDGALIITSPNSIGPQL